MKPKEARKPDHVVHVVRHAHHGKFTTYSLYRDNEPFLIPNVATCVLGRREAHTLAGMFNGKIPWPVRQAA
jgi:hypothetical protein